MVIKRDYILVPQVAGYGRNIWESLITGQAMTSAKLQNDENYTRLTPDAGLDYGICDIGYKNGARIKFIASNNVRIEAKTDEQMNAAEESIISLCKGRGYPLQRLDEI